MIGYQLLLLAVYHAHVTARLSCIDENGAPVDWFISYKLPRLEDAQSQTVQEGSGYVYMDVNRIPFVLSSKAAGDNSSAMGRTLGQIYNNAKSRTEDMAYIWYNDANPDGHEFFDNGHSKGDVAFDKTSGFWLVHSVPRFPPMVQDGYGYPHSGTYYGQMFFCVSFNASQFDAIGLQLRYDDPHVHDSNFPSSFAEQFPNMYAFMQDKIIYDAPYCHDVKLVSSDGQALRHFGKNTNFGKDLYHDFVAPSLKSNLLAETWQHGNNKTGPTCDGYTVENIQDLKVATPSETFSFSNYEDHAKFAIGKSEDKPFVCIGDINRMVSQFHRAGGTLCTEDYKMWYALKSTVVDTDSCNQITSNLVEEQ